jgi:hypothetical protein
MTQYNLKDDDYDLLYKRTGRNSRTPAEILGKQKGTGKNRKF